MGNFTLDLGISEKKKVIHLSQTCLKKCEYEPRKENKQTKNKKRLSALFLKHPIKISIATSLNISTVSALNRSIQEIMKNAARTFLLFALGVANATKDKVTEGK